MVEQSVPMYPAWQTHSFNPITQKPLDEQRFGQIISVQALPIHPSSQWHFPGATLLLPSPSPSSEDEEEDEEDDDEEEDDEEEGRD